MTRLRNQLYVCFILTSMTNWKRKQCAVRAPLSACRVQMVTPKCCLGLTLWFQLDFTSKVNSCAFALGDLVLDTVHKQSIEKNVGAGFAPTHFSDTFSFSCGGISSPPHLPEMSNKWPDHTWIKRKFFSLNLSLEKNDTKLWLIPKAPWILHAPALTGGPSCFLRLQGLQWVLPQSDGSALIPPSLFTPLIQLKRFPLCDCVIFATICSLSL